MRKLINISIVVVLLLSLVPIAASAHSSDDPLVVDLLAGQTTPIGEVQVWNDADFLYVKFVSSGDCLLETHVDVAASPTGIPQTKKGNPVPGQFEYSEPHACVGVYTYDIQLDWPVGTDLYIATHASTGISKSMMIFSDGGGQTSVTAGNVPLATYPYPAVDTWEAFDDPPDTVESYWEQRLTYSGSKFSFSVVADWIWESYRVVNPTTTQYVTFEHTFTIDGYPNSGTLFIATDNTYSASLNGEFVGEHTDWRNWQIVGGYDIYPEAGTNILQIVGSNYGAPGYTIDNNPAGLIYEAEIDYYADGETAWGCGTGNCFDFPGKNWAKYFTYTVQPVCPAIESHSEYVTVTPPLTNVTKEANALDKIQIFEEFVGSLGYDLLLDDYNGSSGSISAGTMFCSYYVHFDQVGDTTLQLSNQTVIFESAAEIIGLIISGGNLGDYAGVNLMFDADDLLESETGIIYPSKTVTLDYLRGLEISSNPDDVTFTTTEVTITLFAKEAYDSFRIILKALPSTP